MADKENNKQQKNSTVTKLLLFGLLPVITGSVLVLGTLFIAGAIPGQGEDSNIAEEDFDEFYEEEDSEKELMEAIYIPLDPAFVVNFSGQGKARYLQVTVEVMVRDPIAPDLVELHMPIIRNNLILLLSEQSYETISTLNGKEALREEALDVIQFALEEETGDPIVEAVYFTSLVMQ